MRGNLSVRKLCLAILAGLVVLALGAPAAQAQTLEATLYCWDSAHCSTNVADAGSSYWTFDSILTINSGTFDYALTLSETGEDSNPGWLNSFSAQFGPSATIDVSSLSWVTNPGSWDTLVGGKGNGNFGNACSQNDSGAFCAAAGSGTPLYLGNGPVTVAVSGSYTGTIPNPWNFQAAVQNGTLLSGPLNGHAIAISTPAPGSPVPEPGTLTLLGSGLLGLAGMIRRRRKA